MQELIQPPLKAQRTHLTPTSAFRLLRVDNSPDLLDWRMRSIQFNSIQSKLVNSACAKGEAWRAMVEQINRISSPLVILKET